MSAASACVGGSALVLAAFVLDMVLGSRITAWGIRPDITLAALAPLAMAVGAGRAAPFGLLAGVVQGAFLSPALGSMAVSRTISAWAVGLLEARFYREHMVVTAAAGFLAAVLADASFYAFAPQERPGLYAARALGRAVYTMLLAMPFAVVVRRLFPRRP